MGTLRISEALEMLPAELRSTVKKTQSFVLSWRDILRLPIPDAFKVEMLLHREFFSAQELRMLACEFAESVLHIADDPRAEDTVLMARRRISEHVAEEEVLVADLLVCSAIREYDDDRYSRKYNALVAARAALAMPTNYTILAACSAHAAAHPYDETGSRYGQVERLAGALAMKEVRRDAAP